MVAKAQDFEIKSGDHGDLVITVTDNADPPVVVDITGATITWEASRDDVMIITKLTDSAAGVEITDGSGGIFKVHLLPADTATLSGVYDHEAQVVSAISKTLTVTEGKMNIIADKIT